MLIAWTHDAYGLLLADVGLILVVASLAGVLFRRLGQPPVIGEVIAGILLGPTLLGSFSTTLFPLTTRPLLKALAELGIALFMYTVGLELDVGKLRGRRGITASVAVVGTLVPFAFGFGLGAVLPRGAHGPDLLPFALFMGAACRSPPSRCWRASSSNGACTTHPWVCWPWARRPATT